MANQNISFRRVRNKNLKGALSTSFLARLAGLILQGVSLPLAANSMGAGGFSTFAILMAATSWLMLASFGITQAVTVRVSHALGQDDMDKAGYHCRSARTWILWVALIVSLFVWTLAFLTPIFEYTLSNHIDSKTTIFYAIVLVNIIFLAQINMTIIESTQLGYQKQKVFGLFLTVGTSASAVAVYLVSVSHSDPLFFLASLHGPTLLARFINSTLFLRAHPECRIQTLAITRASIKDLFASSAPYFFGGSFNHFFCHIFPILIIGSFAPSTYVATVTAVLYALILASAAFNFLLTPLFGSAPEAFSRGDFSWVQGAYLRTLTVNIAFAAGVAAAFAIFGSQIFEVWYQGAVSPDSTMLLTAGIYLIFIALEATNYTFLATAGQVITASKILTIKAFITATLLTIFSFYQAWDIQYMPFGLLIGANIVLSAPPLTFLVLRSFRPLSKFIG